MENRNPKVDFYKGLLMWGVIWGHTITALANKTLNEGIFIHSFFRLYDMPFFMILSGYFLFKSIEKKSFKILFWEKITQLLIPILLWNWIIHFPYPSIGSFYFLWAVFISSILTITVHTITQQLKIKLYARLFLFLGIIISLFSLSHLQFNLFYLYPFFVLGYLSNTIQIKLKFIPLLILFVIGICLWEPEYSPWKTNPTTLNGNFTPIYLFQFYIGAIGSFVMWRIWSFIFKSNSTINLITKIGKETMAIYILQTIAIEIILSKIIRYIQTDIWDGINYLTISPKLTYLMAYVMAPIISFISIIILYKIIIITKSNIHVSKVWGFKITNKQF